MNERGSPTVICMPLPTNTDVITHRGGSANSGDRNDSTHGQQPSPIWLTWYHRTLTACTRR